MTGRDPNRRYHDRISARYDQIYDTPYWRFYREVSWRHTKRWLPSARPAVAADLGCGTGWFGRRLAKAGFTVVFVDPSHGMLERCRARASEELPLKSEPRFVAAGLEDLAAIADASVHFATAQGDPLSFCEDPRRALRELRRILAPGAAAVLSVDSRIAGVRSLQDQPTPERALDLLATGRTAWLAHDQRESFPMKMFDPGELRTLLEKAGFEPLSAIAKTCLVQRHNEAWLADPRWQRELLRAEERVHADPHWFGLAAHLQIAARRV